MSRWVDQFNALGLGFVLSGVIGYCLALFGVERVVGGLILVGVFIAWGTFSVWVYPLPGHRWFVTISSDSKPSGFSPEIRRILRVGTVSELHAYRDTVFNAAQVWGRWNKRNVQWTSVVALAIVFNVSSIIKGKVPFTDMDSLIVASCGVLLQSSTELWLFRRIQHVREILES